MASIKDRNGMDLTEAEDIKNSGKECMQSEKLHIFNKELENIKNKSR